MERLDDAVTRVLYVKERVGLFADDYQPFRPISAEESAFVKAVQKECSDRSMTLIRDEAGLFPLSPARTPRIGIIPVVEHAPAKEDARRMAAAFTERGFTVDYYEGEDISDAARNAMYERNDVVIYALLSRAFRPIGFLDYTAGRAVKVMGAFFPRRAADKTIFVSLGSPYFLNQYFEHAKTYVNGYSMLGCAAEGFVRAACGEVPFTGRSPVQL